MLGLLAAARGLRRTEPIEDLLTLKFGIRMDQPGRMERDFQTARTMDGSTAFPLTYRYYLADAVFIAAVEGDDDLVQGLDAAIRHPVFPLYLGRRSCPPVGPIDMGARQAGISDALQTEPWQAALWWRRRQAPAVQLELRMDIECIRQGDEVITLTDQHDLPISFDPRLRQYGTRSVAQTFITMVNPDSRLAGSSIHDPMAVLGGA